MSSIYSSNLPYTYLIGWSNLNIWYYGRRTAKNCHPSELWKKYFTSSKEVAKFRKDHGEPDIIQVRKTFTDPKKCSLWECRLLKKIDAQHDPRFLNKRNGDYKWDTTGINPSKESNIKRSKKLKKRIITKNHALKISKSLTGIKHTEQRRLNMSINGKGKFGNKGPHNKGKPNEKFAQMNRDNALTYIVTNPQGKQFIIKNLKEFCRQNNLTSTLAYYVCDGKQKQHKGWKFQRYNSPVKLATAGRSPTK
jgi:hypothetical protein